MTGLRTVPGVRRRCARFPARVFAGTQRSYCGAPAAAVRNVRRCVRDRRDRASGRFEERDGYRIAEMEERSRREFRLVRDRNSR